MERYLGLPPDVSTHGGEIDFLMLIVHVIMAILFVGWGVFFVYTLLRFRAGRNPVASHAGAKSHFSTYGEVGIALIEVALLVGFAVPIWARRVDALPSPAESVLVRVVAEQFAWNVHYPGPDGVFGRTTPELVKIGTNPLGIDATDPAAQDDVTMLNQLHLPVGKPILVRLSSKDVIHSFSLPYFRVKQDGIPGMEIPVHFTAKDVTPPESRLPACAAGKTCWEIACAQLCGLTHYNMKGYVTVHEQADFDAWLADQKTFVPKPAPPPTPPPAPVEPTETAGSGSSGT